MITIQGTPKSPGVAIAAAAKVDAKTGINGVSSSILQQGIHSIRNQLDPVDYPEVAVVSDTLVLGASIKIPGISTIAIAAEADDDVPGLEVGVPCVVGLERLAENVSNEQIIIVDGDKGVVHIDPDPQTIIRYQEREEREHAKPSVFLASEHLPALTQDGETVHVYATIESETQLAEALEQGADGLIIDCRPDGSPEYETVLHAAVGKPVMFLLPYPGLEVLHASMRLAMPLQVSALFAIEAFDSMAEEMSGLLETAVTEAFLRELEPPQVSVGTFARDVELAQIEISAEPEMMLIDLRKSPYLGALREDLRMQAPAWLGECSEEAVVFVLGDRVDVLPELVRGGARNVAVNPDRVQAAKYAIREIGPEESG